MLFTKKKSGKTDLILTDFKQLLVKLPDKECFILELFFKNSGHIHIFVQVKP